MPTSAISCTSCGKELRSKQGLTYHRGTCRKLKEETASHLQRRQGVLPPVTPPMQETLVVSELERWKKRKLEDTRGGHDTSIHVSELALSFKLFIKTVMIWACRAMRQMNLGPMFQR